MNYVESRRWIHWGCIAVSLLMLYQSYQWSETIREKSLAQEAINQSLESTNNQLTQLSLIAKKSYDRTLVASEVRDIYHLQGILAGYGLKASEDVRVSKAERFTDRNKIDLGLTSLCLRSANNPMIAFESNRGEAKGLADSLLKNVAVNIKSISLDEKWRSARPIFKSPEVCFLVRD